jgi:predicted Zn-dependent peptidase
MSRIYQEQLPNGLWLIAEPHDTARSLSMTMLVPAGVANEPEGMQGASALLEEVMARGAGGLSARAHCDALDQLGVQRGTNVETHHIRLSATMIAEKIGEASPLLMDMVIAPALEDESLEPSRDLALQTIRSLKDEPQQKVMLDLRERFHPAPLGRSPYGSEEGVAGVTAGVLRDFWKGTCVPGGSVLGFSGRFDWPKLRDMVAGHLSGWQGAREEEKPCGDGVKGYRHSHADTTQVHIAMGYQAVPEPDGCSVLQRAAVAALSGGMSGRLFTEVREKRGLCYSVYATYAAGRERGGVFGYAGTTAARAQETLEVMVGEHVRLSKGIDESEFQRAMVGMKSGLVMQGESTGARASSIATDQFVLGRPRGLDELADRVDGVTHEALNKFLGENPPGEMTVTTIGPEALEVGEEEAVNR